MINGNDKWLCKSKQRVDRGCCQVIHRIEGANNAIVINNL